MSKALPIAGTVCAVLGAASLVVGGDVVPLVDVAAIMVTGVLVLLSRGRTNLVLGIVTLLVGLVPLLNFPVYGNNKTIIPSVGDIRLALTVLACLVPVGVILYVRRPSLSPAWLFQAGLAIAALTAILAFTTPASDYGGAAPLTLFAAALCLVLAWPMVQLMMARPAAQPMAAAPPAAPPTPKAASKKAK
ncbi:MAG: hypothetical protein V4510_09415 [bacterium]